MFCQKCGKEQADENAFCAYCGAQMATGPSSVVPAAGAAKLSWEWKTSVGATVGGITLSVILNLILSALDRAVTAEVLYESAVISFAYGILTMAYAGYIYPKYFTDKPRFVDSALVSFMNGFFGGVIGCLWNSNLTKAKRGISCYVVFALGIIYLALILLLIMLYLVG